MADEDRAWLEKVVSEGVRDDFKAMTEIYSRLCNYLDLAATNPPPPLHRGTGDGASGPISTDQSLPPAAPGSVPATDEAVNISTGAATDFAPPPPPPPAAQASAAGVPPEAAAGTASAGSRAGALSTFIAAAPSFSSPPAGLPEAESAAVEAGASGETRGAAEGVVALEEGLLNDLDELQEIVEQIDAAATFAKIGGFGRLIALVAPASRPEKLRLRAASVIATLTKNNPPAQQVGWPPPHLRLGSGGRACSRRCFRQPLWLPALIEAVSAAAQPDDTSPPAAASSTPPAAALSLPLQRAILHALSSSVMGLAPVEDALCLEPGFQGFLAQALSQEGGGEGRGGDGDGEAVARASTYEEESCKLRSKAAFVLKALISAPEASRERAEALWPAVLGLLTGLEALAARDAGGEDDPAAARESCIEALLAASRGLDGDRVVRDLGARVSRVAARRRHSLVAARGAATRSQEDLDCADFELGLWSEWDALTGPAQ
eukprot:g8457.t1